MAVPSFRIKALCDLHGVDEGARQEVISKIGKLKDPIITCKQIEDVIVNMTATYVDSPNKKQKLVRTLHHKRYFNILDGGQYRWVTTMIAKQQFCGKTKTYADIDAISIQPVSVQALSAAEREFGSDRLLFVTFMDVTDMKYLDEVISKMNKIQFGGQSFHFLGGKVNDKKSIRNDTSMMPSNVFDSKSFVAWYVAIQGNDTQSSWDHCNTGNRGPKLHVPNLQEVRLWYGQFPAGTLPSKINARLQLAFTSSHQSSLQVSSFVVTVEPDIYSPDGNIMTDGCGFISVGSILQFSLLIYLFILSFYICVG